MAESGVSRQNLDDTQLAFIREIEVLGGKYDRSESLPGGPLVSVTLRGTKITDDGLAGLSNIISLRSLDLANTQITDTGIIHLRGLAGLESLNLLNTKVSDNGVRQLAGLKHIDSLDLSLTAVTDEGLRHLAGLTEMKRLFLTGTAITDAGLAHLKGMTKLQWLFLNKDRITDAGIEHLRPLTELKLLWLFKTGITDKGMVHLKSLTRLENLVIAVTGITDAGLVPLHELKALKKIDVTGTQVSAAGVEALQAALPRLIIVGAPRQAPTPSPSKSAGASRTSLLLNRSVQAELHLDAAQTRKAVAIAEEARARTDAAAADTRDLPAEARQENFARILNWRDRRIDAELAAVFTPDQLQRFRQIRYQVGGLATLNQPELQRDLGLTREQQTAIGNLLRECEKASNDVLQGFGLSKDPEHFDKARARSEISVLRNKYLSRALELLDAEQVRTWGLLTGKPFEFGP